MTPLHTHGEEAPAQREPLLVRVEEAARLLSLSRSMVYQLMDSGVLPSIRCGTARRIPLAALHARVAQQLLLSWCLCPPTTPPSPDRHIWGSGAVG